MTMLSPGGARSYRRPRHIWRRLGAVVLVLALLGGGTAAAWWYLVRENPDGATTTPCPTPSAASTLPPLRPTAVKLNVYNATRRDGLAARVAAELRKRGFDIRDVANDPEGKRIRGTAELRHGADGVRSVQLVRAYVPKAKAVADDRVGTVVDVVLGRAFKDLNDKKQVRKALRRPPSPLPRPPGC